MPQLDLNSIWVAKVECLPDAVDGPDRRMSHALRVQAGDPSGECVVGRDVEGEMIKSGQGGIEALSGVRFVLVQIHDPGTVERHNRPAELEVLNRARRDEADSPKDPAVEIQTSAQIRYGDAKVIELDGRGRRQGMVHYMSIARSIPTDQGSGSDRRPRSPDRWDT